MNQYPARSAIGESEDRWQKKLFLLCGNHSEFSYWARRIINASSEYTVIYAYEPRIMRGYRNESYICLGNWFRTRDFVSEEMIHLMRASEFTEVQYSDIFGFQSEEDERIHCELDKKSGYFVEFLSEEEMWI